ncbi:GntR family transcriptional regulator [Levilinea saccharolytica]|uniref:Transcriptional regulator, GntR family n=1 Tax=Levilinea saccharolytica TaxID=229921 RepID=A0A0M9U3H2_9CHLR|nr:GntR family transcriptional regulator [Levilinea saccharolytica]GAP19786.1 transcriptional regulator, GntR family [Levilinea saccharolytica]GAP19811.1 transcriptional regulator, GntR family [Levilinea saccharolytica]
MPDLHIQLDFGSDVPIYNQIVAQVQELVLMGALHPGDQLPTVRQLAAELRVNFNTVARAYRILDESRLISTQQGRGTYILGTPDPHKSEAARRRTLEELARRYRDSALGLGFSTSEALAALQALLSTAAEEPSPAERPNTAAENGPQEKV